MKKLILIASLTLSSYGSSETVKGYKIDPENCLAALSIVKDSPGSHEAYSLVIEVEMNIFNSLTDYPDFSLIESQKISMNSLGDEVKEIVLSCEKMYKKFSPLWKQQ
jgi:hypothetical protein